MLYADEINEIASKLTEWGRDVSDSPVYVSQDIYDEMIEEASQWGHGTPGIRTLQFYSYFGLHRVCADRNLPPKTIHIERLTLTDIIVEDILLDVDLSISDD